VDITVCRSRILAKEFKVNLAPTILVEQVEFQPTGARDPEAGGGLNPKAIAGDGLIKFEAVTVN
jgi:hypothetical protein